MHRPIHSWIAVAVALLWALWFGGIIALFIFVQTLFADVPRETFIQTAPHLFFAFERYQLVLAAIALTLTVLWRIAGSSRATTVFTLLAAATLLAALNTAVITPRIERLRIAGQTQTLQFKKSHGLSMVAYLAESFVLLGVGIVTLWPSAIGTTSASAPASPSPAAADHPAQPVPA
jgi:hypothetical protein